MTMTSTGSMPFPPPQTREFGERILALEEEVRRELEQTVQSQREIALLLSTTNSEVEKFAARELQLSNRVRDMEMHLDNYGREDIRDLYTNGNEIQLRLYMMRSQAEQLQGRQQHLKEYQEKLHMLIELLALIPIESHDDDSDEMAAASDPASEGVGLLVDAGLFPIAVIEAQEDERLRIAREIQDGPTQTLVNLVPRAEICARLIDRDVDEARAELLDLKERITTGLLDTRRLIFELRPLILDELGLVPTVRRYLTEIARLKGGFRFEVISPSGIDEQIDLAADARLSATMQIVLFRTVQSVLSVLLTEGSVEQVTIQIERGISAVRLAIEARGVETERSAIEERLQGSEIQKGLAMFGASLVATPQPPRGMLIEVMLPVPEEALAYSDLPSS